MELARCLPVFPLKVCSDGICTVSNISTLPNISVELLGGDRASVWTYTGDTFDPDKTDGLTYQIGGVFQDLDKYVAEALADPTATWDTDDWDNIIHESAPESALEAEP